MMASPPPDAEIDEQLATDMQGWALQRLKTELTPVLEKHCEASDKVIAEACQAIKKEIKLFTQRKQKLFATLRNVEGENRAREVIRSGLNDIEPHAYEDILRVLFQEGPGVSAINKPFISSNTRAGIQPPPKPDEARKPSCTAEPSTPPPSAGLQGGSPRMSGALPTPLDRQNLPAISPAISPSLRPQDTAQSLRSPIRSPPAATASASSTARGNPFLPWKRPAPQTAATSSTPAKKAKLSDPATPVSAPPSLVQQPLPEWEVDGLDYIFKYPQVGQSWFVLRCNQGKTLNPRHFPDANPFENGEAAAHFNGSKKFKCHDTSRKYTDDEIMRNFGHRVIEVDDQWVRASNQRAIKDHDSSMAKWKVAKKGQQQPKMGPARRAVVPSSANNVPRAPEANMS